MADAGVRRPFIGRDRERATLVSAVTSGLDGQPTTVMVSGEAGIGKSRLVREAMAAMPGITAVIGTCWDDAGTPAMWPWRRILSVLGEGSPLDDPGRPPTPDEGAVFALFEDVTNWLRQRVAASPVVVVIEDLHRADVASVRLLRHLARSSDMPGMAMIATVRMPASPEADVADAIALLVAEPTVRQLSLQGLDADSVAALAAERLGLAPGPADLGAAHDLHRRTGGNPFFIAEALELAASAGLGSLRDKGLTPGVTETVGRRLDHVSADVGRLLAVLSLLRSDASLALLRRLDWSRDVHVLVDEAERAALIEAAPGLGRYRLRHALVAEVARTRLRSQERARIHLAIATALEAQLLAGSVVPPEELAHHFLEATPALVDHRAVLYARAAGDEAARLCAYEEAARLYRLGLDAADLAGGCPAVDRFEISLALARAAERSGDGAAAASAARACVELARGMGDARRIAAAALATSAVTVEFHAERVSLLHESLEELEADDDRTRAAVLGALAGETLLHDRHAALRHSADAVAAGRASGDRDALFDALAIRRVVLLGPDRLDEQATIGDELLGLAGATDLRRLAEAHQARAAAALGAGDVDAFRSSAVALADVAARGVMPLHRAWANVMQASVALLEGRLDDAERIATSTLDYCARAALEAPAQFALAHLAAVAWEHGEPLQAAPQGTARAAGASIAWSCGLLAVEAPHADAASIEARLDGLVGEDAAALPRDMFLLGALGALATAAAVARSRRHARSILDALTPFEGRLATFGVGVVFGPIDFHVGRLLLILEEREAGRAALERAALQCQRIGARLWGARCHLELASSLEPVEPAAALRHATAAVDAAASAGARAVADASLALRSRLARSQPQRPGGLSEREVEVLALLATGATNQEIAGRLFLSVKTVERHLGSIYAKIGAKGRPEAVAFAVRHGIAVDRR
jgi:DNA-binding CsgD family transcriptional regulator